MAHSEFISVYMSKLVAEAYGTDVLVRILKATAHLENGRCAVESSNSTFPRLLELKGIYPERSYAQEYGVPLEDGVQAATHEQRELIWDAIEAIGIQMRD